MKLITYKIFKEHGTFGDDGSRYCHYFICRYFLGINIGRVVDRQKEATFYADSIPEAKTFLTKLLTSDKTTKKIEEVKI